MTSGIRHNGNRGPIDYGPWRPEVETAIMDYREWFENEGTVAAKPQPNKHGHLGNRRKPLPDTPEVRAALDVLKRARQAAGQTGYVYLIAEGNHTGPVKIGYSTNPVSRLRELQTGNHRTLVLVAMRVGTLADEAALKAKYAEYNLAEEWFTNGSAIRAEFGL